MGPAYESEGPLSKQLRRWGLIWLDRGVGGETAKNGTFCKVFRLGGTWYSRRVTTDSNLINLQ